MSGPDEADGLLEPVDPLAGRRQVDPVATVLVLMPARAEAEDEPAAADVVDRDGLLEKDRRVAERIARDEDAEADPRGEGGDRGERRPRLVDRVLRRAVGVDEVVDEPGRVEAERLGEAELLEDAIPRLVRLAEEEPEADRDSHRCAASPSFSRPAPSTASTSQTRGVRPVRAG